MKKTFLIGLAAVALGSMTACTNILEEEGIVSPSAKTGNLQIGLTQSPINVVTKAEAVAPFEISKYINDVLITLSANSSDVVQPTGTTLPTNSKYSDIIGEGTDLIYKVNVSSSYSLTASLTKMESNTYFGFDMPNFSGTTNEIQPVPNTTTEAKVSCTLTNSIISINLDGLTPDGTDVVKFIPTSLVLKNGTTEFKLIESETKVTTWTGDAILFAKDGIPAKIELTGYLSNDGNKTSISTGDISVGKSTGEGDNITYANTASNTKYDIKYVLNGDEGKLNLVININNLTEVVPINVTVNPYN